MGFRSRVKEGQALGH